MNAGAAATKAEIRRAMLAARRGLPGPEREERARTIARRLGELPAWRDAGIVHVYIGAVDGEVETREIVREGLERGMRVLCPRVRWSPRGLDTFEIRSLDDLEEGERGLAEPAPDRARRVAPGTPIDLVVVPGIAFDREGRRIGYGAGFYDRFLAETDAPRVALAYSLQVIDAVPAEPHDEPVDWIVTEEETIACRAERAPDEGETREESS